MIYPFSSFKKSADLKVKISYLYLAKILNEKNLVNELFKFWINSSK